VNYERILVCGAHPDDELTMAATMAKLADQGCEVYVCISTDGCEGYPKPEWKDKIVEMRRQEQEECDKVLGIKQRYHIGAPDMGLENNKQYFQRFIEVIREVRPQALFTHGPHEYHRDHRGTHELALEAVWQAGQPVSADLGQPWVTPHVFYYKGVADRRAMFRVDVSEYAHKRLEARATQVSQHTLFGMTREEFLRQAEELKRAGGKHYDTFWPTERMVFNDLPPKDL